jgi:hypothetical protein
MSIHFYDSASPENIPSGVYAAVNIDGDFAWSERDIHRMARVFRYVVHPTVEKSWMARGVDIENGDATVAEAMPFLIARHRNFGDATAYVNRSTLPVLREAVSRAGITVYEWVATLDGTQNVEGAWAVQDQGGVDARFDLSILHGVNNFHTP